MFHKGNFLFSVVFLSGQASLSGEMRINIENNYTGIQLQCQGYLFMLVQVYLDDLRRDSLGGSISLLRIPTRSLVNH
jgi:hypothetical protein